MHPRHLLQGSCRGTGRAKPLFCVFDFQVLRIIVPLCGPTTAHFKLPGRGCLFVGLEEKQTQIVKDPLPCFPVAVRGFSRLANRRRFSFLLVDGTRGDAGGVLKTQLTSAFLISSVSLEKHSIWYHLKQHSLFFCAGGVKGVGN